MAKSKNEKSPDPTPEFTLNLGPRFEVRDDETAKSAAEEILSIDNQLAVIDAEEKQALAELKKAFHDRRKGICSKTEMELPERRNALYAMLLEYLDDHREFFPDGKKTRDCGTFTVQHVDAAERVGYLEGNSKSSVLKTILNKHNVMDRVANLLVSIGVSNQVKMKADLDVTGIGTLVKSRSMTHEELEELGLEFSSTPTIKIAGK